MNDEKMQEIISNPDNIIKIIEALNDNFSMLYLKYTMKSLKNLNSNIDYNNMNLHSATSYYLNGHCVSYAEILCQIFEKYAIKYNSDGHIIVKIGEHFYDARGLIDNIVDEEYHMTTDEDLFYMDINFGIKDNLEIPIEKDLIEIGKEELNQLYENSIAKSR